VNRNFPFVLLVVAGIPGACSQTTAITDVTVINPRTRSVLTHRTVIIGRDRIVEIRPSSRKPLAPHARVISGKQKFLIPGLWDAHVHLTKAGVLSLPVFVANGVTGVRDMAATSTR
jgi:cytosine/adenosine deaminase-related metal-dependent hydrolase